MTGSSSDITLASLGAAAGYPGLNVATVPQDIRDGGSKALEAYAEGLSFEGVLVNELSQQMASTMFDGDGLDGTSDSDGLDGSGDGSTDGSSDASSDGSSSGGLLSGASAYASLIPQTLTTSIMDAGGLGMAAGFAQQIDPALATEGASSGESTSGASADVGGGQVSA